MTHAGFPQVTPWTPGGIDGLHFVRWNETKGGTSVTLIWFVVWFIWNLVGDTESLTFDPVNWWAGLLLLAIALDLSRQHAPQLAKPSRGD